MSNVDWSQVADTQEQQILSRKIQGMALRGSEGGGAAAPQPPAASSPGAPVQSAFVAPPGPNPVTMGRGRGLIRVAQGPPPGVRPGPGGEPDSRADPAEARENVVTPPQAASAAQAADDQSEGLAGGDSATDDPGLSRADASLINKMLRSRLINSTSDIEVLRKDPNSPLYHVKSFKNLRLKPELLRGVYDMGFDAPSKIQETALPALLADPPANMIAQSQSGTGKTAAFVLTMLSRVDSSKPYPQCICLAPTYELALQIGDVTRRMAKFMPDVSVRFAIRGEWVDRGSKITDHIVIGTPGTLMDWVIKIKCFDPKLINVFVLDEADVMIDKQGHADQSVRIQRELRKDCQMLLFSATYDEEIMKFATHLVSNPMIIRLKREEESLENIHQYYIECANRQDKLNALTNIYGSITIGQSVIFCHTRHTANWLVAEMTRQGNAVALLTGELDVKQRADIIARFRAGKEKVLVTTNVSARGIDVDQVTVVVNFDLPVDQRGQIDCETYLHRIGRTGRFGKNGLAINMCDSTRTRSMLQILEKHFGRKIHKLDAENPDELEKIGIEQNQI